MSLQRVFPYMVFSMFFIKRQIRMKYLLFLLLFALISCENKKSSMTEEQYREWREKNDIQNSDVIDERELNKISETDSSQVVPASRKRGISKEFLEYEKRINEEYKPKSLYE